MANVLSELFQDIADSIRVKTGETGTIKPIDFPSKISGISSADLDALGVKSSTGSFVSDASGTSQTVEHGLEESPDFVFVYAQQGLKLGETTGLVHLYGFSDTFGSTATIEKRRGICGKNVNNMLYVQHSYDGIECDDTFFGYIRNANETSFQVGGEIFTLYPSIRYDWLALSMKNVTKQTAEEILENMEIGVDFSEGDQPIYAPDGYVVKSAILKKPYNLVPENIASGVDIAGVIGSFIGSGGGVDGVVAASGYLPFSEIQSMGDVQVIEHNLGVVPDVVIVYLAAYDPVDAALAVFLFGLSDKLATKTGITDSYNVVLTKTATGGYFPILGDDGIESSVNITGNIRNANSKTFSAFGYNIHSKADAGGYYWIAIGGLT